MRTETSSCHFHLEVHPTMSNSSSSSALHQQLIMLSSPIQETLSKTPYTPPEPPNPSIKSLLLSLLPSPHQHQNDVELIKNFSLCCALLASSSSLHTSSSDLLGWIPKPLSHSATSAFCALLKTHFMDSVEELMHEVVPLLKERIKESCIDMTDEADDVSAASARAPVGYAVVAAHQFRWFVSQVEYPQLGKLCSLVIPCALTALDHWSPEVKGQGMISFIHLGENVNAAEFGLYEDVILDTCCQNIACSDEIWQYIVEMSVVFVTCTQRSNPRSPWFERLLNEMLSHLERQPRNKERRIAWLDRVEPLFNSVGLVLLAHFRRIFPLFFQWIHADDDHTVLLALKRIHTVIKLTWIRNTPYIERLVDELVNIYKEAALRKVREEIRMHVVQILTLLQQCKGLQFETAWEKHRDDPNLTSLSPSFCRRNAPLASDEAKEAGTVMGII